MSAHSRPIVFRTEGDLEDYLEARLSPLLSLFGHEVLIVGRQVDVGGRRSIDLLAIDSTGVVYNIELKVDVASPSVIAQVLDYRYSSKRLDRANLIHLVAHGLRQVRLDQAFQRHFGHPLPRFVNESQVLVIIAASFHLQVAHSILELNERKDSGYSIAAFRFVVQPGGVSLVPCCRNAHEVHVEKSHLRTEPTVSTKPFQAAKSIGSPPYRLSIDENVRRFWLAQRIDVPLVTAKSIYQRYLDWRGAQAAEGVHVPLLNAGLFGRQLVAIAAASGEWTRVFIALKSRSSADEPLNERRSYRTHRDAGHWVVAYRRN